LTAVIVTVLIVAGSQVRSASAGSPNVTKMFEAAYFSNECRQTAQALDSAHTADAFAIFTAFAHRPQRGGAPDATAPDVARHDCLAPAILLLNLFRLNGIDAEVALVSTMPADPAAAEIGIAGEIDRVVVFVTALRRYFDPAAPVDDQASLDQHIRATTTRVHLIGPSLVGARGGCPDTCMAVYAPRPGG
jgi:hypothetical protein